MCCTKLQQLKLQEAFWTRECSWAFLAGFFDLEGDVNTLDSLDDEGLHLSIAPGVSRNGGLTSPHLCGRGHKLLATTTSTVESVLPRHVNFLVLMKGPPTLFWHTLAPSSHAGRSTISSNSV